MATLDEIKTVQAQAKCLYNHEQVLAAVDQMAVAINERLADTNPIVLTVMNAAVATVGCLLTRLNFPLEFDYVHATRYRGGTEGMDLHWYKKPVISLKGRTVLLVDDVLDGGVTLAEIIAYCKQQGATAVYTAVLVDKYEKRLPNGLPEADFVGLRIEDHYIFGFGMDYHEYLRNLPGIYYLPPSDS